MSANLRSLKVAIYDPSTGGGITHYTFGLANGLSNAGCLVTVITSVDYELQTLKRSFDVWFAFTPSRVSAWIRRFRSIIPGVGAPSGSLEGAGRASAVPRHVEPLIDRFTGALKTVRLAFVLSRIALRLLLGGTEVVHVQWLVDRRADLFFLRLLRRFRIKVVYTAHDVLPHDEYTKDNHRYFQTLYRLPNILVVHSETNRREMLERFNLDPTRIAVIPMGCQRLFIEHFGVNQRTARNHLGISHDARVVLFFGLIKPYKGLEYLLQAFDPIKMACDKALLLIAGKIYDVDPHVHRHYSALLAEYADRDDVRFRDEYVRIEEVAHYFSAADVVVLPYVTASQSAVLLSAYAEGKPVVVTDSGGLAEVVRDGETGFVVPPKNAAAIAHACITILNDHEVSERFSRQSRLLGSTVYSWDSIGESTLKLYASLVEPAAHNTSNRFTTEQSP